MNKKAEELGLKDTRFVTPHGLDKDGHYTTSYELALLADYAMQNDKFKSIVGTRSYTLTINGNPKTINTTNELLGYLNGVYGVKTGFTNKAGRCLVTSTLRGDMDIICVVLGADTKKIRTQDSIKLIEYVFKNYDLVNIESKINDNFEEWKQANMHNIDIVKGEHTNIETKLSVANNYVFPMNNNEQNSIDINIDTLKVIEAPVYNGTVIGTLEAKINNNTILSQDIVVTNTINKKTAMDYFIELLRNYKIYLEENAKITIYKE